MNKRSKMNFDKRRRKELNSWFCSTRANCSSEEKALPIQVKNKLNNLYEIRSSSASDVRRTKRVRASRTRTKRCSKIGKHASADFRRQSFILTEIAFRNKNYLSAHFRFSKFRNFHLIFETVKSRREGSKELHGIPHLSEIPTVSRGASMLLEMNLSFLKSDC